jgi:hypothetical protein
MSLTGEKRPRPSLRHCSLAVVIVCSGVWLGSTEALAQNGSSALPEITQHASAWSLQGAGCEKTPYLVVGMADLNSLRFASVPMAGGDAGHPSAGDSITPAADSITSDVGPAASVDRADRPARRPLVMSSLSDLRAQPLSSHEINQPVPHFADADAYSLLVGKSASQSFLYGDQPDVLGPEQRLAQSEVPSHEVEPPVPSPLIQFQVGSWNIPIMLSSAFVSR